MNWIYRFLLQRNIKKNLKKSKRKKSYRNLKDIKTVLVLFEMERWDEANLFIQQLKKLKKKVSCFVYQDTKKDEPKSSKTSYNIVVQKDACDLSGKSLVRLTHLLGENKFDLAVNLTFKENLLLQYIFVKADSPFKVGFYKSNLPMYDMIISSPSEDYTNKCIPLNELGSQLIYYLTTIDSNTKKT